MQKLSNRLFKVLFNAIRNWQFTQAYQICDDLIEDEVFVTQRFMRTITASSYTMECDNIIVVLPLAHLNLTMIEGRLRMRVTKGLDLLNPRPF